MACLFVNHWQKSFRDSLELDIDAFQRMWNSNFIDAALMDAGALFLHYFAAGVPLPEIASLCAKYAEAFHDYQQITHWYINAPLYQATLNLLGKSDNTVALSGEIIDVDACRILWTNAHNPMATYFAQLWSMILAFHFNSFDTAKQQSKAMPVDLFKDGPNPGLPLRPFYTSLVYFNLYKESGKKKYRRKAISSMNVLKSWSAKGAVNCLYMTQLLGAQLEASRGNLDKAVGMFERGIQSTKSLKLIHHKALGNELVMTVLAEEGHEQRASVYFIRAIDCYKKWGAEAIVKDLRAWYGRN